LENKQTPLNSKIKKKINNIQEITFPFGLEKQSEKEKGVLFDIL
jgi:hypothetical protein